MADEKVAETQKFPQAYVRITLVTKESEDSRSVTVATDYISDDTDVATLRNSVGSFNALKKYMQTVEERATKDQIETLTASLAEGQKKLAALRASQAKR